jgi:hypothetical protein
MAKAQGPLFSISASGTLAKSMVFAGWKGINVVRQWVKPANPMKDTQGDQRIMLGGTGRSVGKVGVNSSIAQQLITLGLIPSGQTKQSYLVSYILNHYLTDAAAYAALLVAFNAHAHKQNFIFAAAALGIVDFDLDYAAVGPYVQGFGLYLIALTCVALQFTGAPYTTAVVDWAGQDINDFAADMTA